MEQIASYSLASLLTVQQRIDYKVALLTFKVRSTSTPSYPRLLIQDPEHGRNLRSTTTALCQPSTATTFAKRAFRCCAPAVGNSLRKTVLSSSLGADVRDCFIRVGQMSGIANVRGKCKRFTGHISSDSVAVFKFRLKTFLFSKAFSSSSAH